MSVINAINNQKFIIRHQFIEAGKESIFKSYEDLNLCQNSIHFLKNKKNIEKLWQHQYNAVREFKAGNNICVTTSTSSGKTEIFQICAIEALWNEPDARVLAIYPMKALNRQQLERWNQSGLKIGKIDGDVPMEERLNVLSNSEVVVMTPDTVHAFLLGNLNNNKYGETIKNFIKKISVIIIDELHLYKGLFGTNTAYLFRRLNNIRRLLRNEKKGFAKYIVASATMPNAIRHSTDITGVNHYVEIDISQDGSPSAPKTFYFIESPYSDNIQERNNHIARLVYEMAQIDDIKSLTFVEGRQRAGQMAFSSEDSQRIQDDAEKTGIYPYRAGYGRDTIDEITSHLEEGHFKGIISTSALEIGIDIDGLNVVVIADMPHDKNSYLQRIGRCGRFGCNGMSYVIIVKDENSFASRLLFESYNYDMNKALPDYEPALYIEDESVQNQHALCHVGDNEECEYALWKENNGRRAHTFSDGGCFPDSFVQLCNEVLNGQMTEKYRRDSETYEKPHYQCSLRYFGKQFEIFDYNNNEITDEPIDRNKVATEAYPHAVRNTMIRNKNIRQRVIRVDQPNGRIYVRPEKNQFIRTSPRRSTYLVPNVKDNTRNISLNSGDVSIYNLEVTEHITIHGFYEQIGRGRTYHEYDEKFRLRGFYTNGTLFIHPSFANKEVNLEQIAEIIYETFLQENAFDRNDINYIKGYLTSSLDKHPFKTKFVSIYDATNTNISKRVAEPDRLKNLFLFLKEHIDIIPYTICSNIKDETIASLESLCDSIINNEITINHHPEIGKEWFKALTEIAYLSYDKENPDEEPTKQIGIYLGKGNMADTINIFIKENKEYKTNVNLEFIERTENTIMEIIN